MMERVSGKCWEDNVRQMLFEPLGLSSMTFGFPPSNQATAVAWGHGRPSSSGRTVFIKHDPDEYGDPPFGSPGGSVLHRGGFSPSGPDFHIQGANGNGTLLSRGSFARLHTPTENQHFALGWEVETTRDGQGNIGERSIYHGGFSGRSRANMWFSPESRIGMVIIYNHGGDDKVDAYKVVAAIAVIAGCSRFGIKGDGAIKTENRQIADFSALEVSGAYQINWSNGKPGLTISTDQNLLPLITASVSGNTLQIESKENLRPTKGITINVSSASLTDVLLNGAVSLTASNLSGPDLKLESNGASSISADGSVTNLEANFSGASKLNAKSLQTQTATLSLSGASYADVTVTNTLNASISGAGLLTYSGNPKSVEKNISGAGRIQPRP